MKDPRDIILAPVVSEKSYDLMEAGVYTFKVHPSISANSCKHFRARQQFPLAASTLA